MLRPGAVRIDPFVTFQTSRLQECLSDYAEARGIYQKFWGDVVSPRIIRFLESHSGSSRFFFTARYVIRIIESNLFDVGVKTLLEGLALNVH